MSNTPRRTVRISTELWTAAAAKASTHGETVADVIRRTLEAYVSTHAAVPKPGPRLSDDDRARLDEEGRRLRNLKRTGVDD